MVEIDTFFAANAAALSLGDCTAKMLGQGIIDIMLIKSSGGTYFVAGAGPQAALVILLSEKVELFNPCVVRTPARLATSGRRSAKHYG